MPFNKTDQTTWRFQHRALQIIFGNVQYDEALRLSNMSCLAEHRHEHSRTFFQKITRDKSNVLWYLLPAKRDLQITAQLRSARQYQMRGLTVTKTLSSYSVLTIFSDIMICSICVSVCVCVNDSMCELLFNPAFGCQKSINVCLFALF